MSREGKHKELEVAAYAVKSNRLALKPYVVVCAGWGSIRAKRNYSTIDKVSPRPCNLSQVIATEVKDVLINPPKNPYDVLKETH